jgi:hypothetical protein
LGKEKKSKCGGEEKNGKNRWEKALVNWVPGGMESIFSSSISWVLFRILWVDFSCTHVFRLMSLQEHKD